MLTRRLRSLVKASVALFTIAIIVIIFKKSGNSNSGPPVENGFKIEFVNRLEDSHNNLFDLKNFKYKYENREQCTHYKSEKLAVMLVMSYVGHDDLRAAHRQTISQESLSKMGIVRMFMLANIPSKKERFISQSQIDDENSRFKDIIQGDFIDDYRNLTYKHMMGLKWASENCGNFQYILKMDDDIVFDIFRIREYLGNGVHHSNFIAGYMLEKQPVIRNKASKWFVQDIEFSSSTYPTYLSGWLYITTPATAAELYDASKGEDFFWIDDILITGVLRSKLDITAIRLNQWYSANAEFMKCCVRDFKVHSYECDYVLGPNGGDTRMLWNFLEGSKKCYLKKCFKRPASHLLNKTCVAEYQEFLPGHGDAVVKPIKL